MMIHKLLAYWQPRVECLDQLFTRLHALLFAIGSLDDRLAGWHVTADTRSGALGMKLDVASAKSLLSSFIEFTGKRTKPSHSSEAPIVHGIWNGLDGSDTASIEFQFGGGAMLGTLFLHLPDDLGPLLMDEKSIALVASCAESFDVGWCGLAASLSIRTRKFSVARPFADWTFFASYRNLLRKSAPVKLASKECVDGLIVQVDRPYYDPSDAEHLNKVAIADEWLDREWIGNQLTPPQRT